MTKILLRFDDLSEYSCFDMWRKIECALVKYNLKPLIAVIPDNRDLKVCKNEIHKKQISTDEFWDKVRKWQSEYKWEIAPHGLHHSLAKVDDNFLRFSQVSEFAGLSLTEKKTLIETSLGIFKRQRVEARTWVSPAHGFDVETLSCLSASGIKFISDGLYYSVVRKKENNLIFVPQQAWSFRTFYPFRVTTICMHHLSWTKGDFDRFEKFLSKNQQNIFSFEDVINDVRNLNYFDVLLNNFLSNLIIKKKNSYNRN